VTLGNSLPNLSIISSPHPSYPDMIRRIPWPSRSHFTYLYETFKRLNINHVLL
jgi:hypothetical protein